MRLPPPTSSDGDDLAVRGEGVQRILVDADLDGLVLTTLHTNDAPSTIARLRDMGIPGYLLEPSLRLIVAQRLVRRLCERCREPYQVEERQFAAYGHTGQGLGPVTVFAEKGCAACNFTGFSGRVAIYEVMPIVPAIQDLIIAAAPTNEIRRVAKDLGMTTLREAGLFKVIQGATTISEVVRVTADLSVASALHGSMTATS